MAMLEITKDISVLMHLELILSSILRQLTHHVDWRNNPSGVFSNVSVLTYTQYVESKNTVFQGLSY